VATLAMLLEADRNLRGSRITLASRHAFFMSWRHGQCFLPRPYRFIGQLKCCCQGNNWINRERCISDAWWNTHILFREKFACHF